MYFGMRFCVLHGPETRDAPPGPTPPTPGTVGGGTILKWLAANPEFVMWIVALVVVIVIVGFVGGGIGGIIGSAIGRRMSPQLPLGE